MYFFIFHCRPKPGSLSSKESGGAYVNCWIEASDIAIAEKIAISQIDPMEWQVLEKEEAYQISRQDYSDESTGLEHYEQAVIDKCVLVFHVYPPH